jgi:hypothetical protein
MRIARTEQTDVTSDTRMLDSKRAFIQSNLRRKRQVQGRL